MKIGVVYKFKKHHKINGTLFYCFEYFHMLKQYNNDTHLLIIDSSPTDIQQIKRIFSEKYTADVECVKSISTIKLFSEQCDHTVVLDIHTLNCCFEFLTGHVHCFSNEQHPMKRYTTNNRKITYYGSYPYQSYDVYCLLKLNFSIFKPLSSQGTDVFISSVDTNYLRKHKHRWKAKYALLDKQIITKQSHTGIGNIFDEIDTVLYIHSCLDTNNRIIPESFFYKKHVTIENDPYSAEDSVIWRYNDISANGLDKYTLTRQDEIITACLK
jgi:hypothetical protein